MSQRFKESSNRATSSPKYTFYSLPNIIPVAIRSVSPDMRPEFHAKPYRTSTDQKQQKEETSQL